jgi:Hg(II)-responsive transcriptional regulator
MSHPKPLTIGQVAKVTELPVETIRYYQREGLIDEPPRPLSGGYRTYPESTIQRLHLIRRAKKLGFTLAEIHALLQIDGEAACVAANAFAQEKLAELEQKIDDLHWMRDTLQSIVNQCDNRGCRHDCNILQTLQNPAIAFVRPPRSTEG